jgi:hypothetical protein
MFGLPKTGSAVISSVRQVAIIDDEQYGIFGRKSPDPLGVRQRHSLGSRNTSTSFPNWTARLKSR